MSQGATGDKQARGFIEWNGYRVDFIPTSWQLSTHAPDMDVFSSLGNERIRYPQYPVERTISIEGEVVDYIKSTEESMATAYTTGAIVYEAIIVDLRDWTVWRSEHCVVANSEEAAIAQFLKEAGDFISDPKQINKTYWIKLIPVVSGVPPMIERSALDLIAEKLDKMTRLLPGGTIDEHNEHS